LIPVQDYVGKMPTAELEIMYLSAFVMKGTLETHFHDVINLQQQQGGLKLFSRAIPALVV
jgi:hypothetical protein